MVFASTVQLLGHLLPSKNPDLTTTTLVVPIHQKPCITYVIKFASRVTKIHSQFPRKTCQVVKPGSKSILQNFIYLENILKIVYHFSFIKSIFIPKIISFKIRVLWFKFIIISYSPIRVQRYARFPKQSLK